MFLSLFFHHLNRITTEIPTNLIQIEHFRMQQLPGLNSQRNIQGNTSLNRSQLHLENNYEFIQQFTLRIVFV